MTRWNFAGSFRSSHLRITTPLAAVLLFAVTLLAPEAVQAADPCCGITAIDTRTGIVTAQVKATGKAFQFQVKDRALLSQLRVGQGVFANLQTKQVSLDGKNVCCSISTTAAGRSSTTLAPGAASSPAPGGTSTRTSAAASSAAPGRDPRVRELKLVKVYVCCECPVQTGGSGGTGKLETERVGGTGGCETGNKVVRDCKDCPTPQGQTVRFKCDCTGDSATLTCL
jgi:hypothetical protein